MALIHADLEKRPPQQVLDEAKSSGWRFLSDVACTWDEHDQTENALEKPFPLKLYIRVICRAFAEFDLLFVEKSRQVMMTWILAALFLHDALIKKARRHFFQSVSQGPANGVLDRARHIYNQAVKSNAPWIPKVKMTGEKAGTTDKMYFPDLHSTIRAIPQGPDIVRSWTCSGILGDEMNHQPQFEAGYEGAQPSIKGGKYIAVGTPNGKNFAYRLMYALNESGKKMLGAHQVDSRRIVEKLYEPPEDLNKEEQREWIEHTLLSLSDEEFNAIPFDQLVACVPGMAYWHTSEEAASVHVLSVHYSSDPDKSPDTARGRAWIHNEKRGMSKNKWRKEYEIDYTAFSGQPVIGDYSDRDHVKPLEPDPNYPIELFIDFGKNCFAGIGQIIPIDGTPFKQARILEEIFLQRSNTIELIDEVMKLLMGKYEPWWSTGRVNGWCDPAGNQARETTADTSRNTSVLLFAEYGIYLDSKKFGLQESVDFVDTLFSRSYPIGEDKEVKAVLVAEHCEYIRSVLGGGWRYPEGDKGTFQKPEKDGYFEHGGDAIRYFLCNTIWERDVVIDRRVNNTRVIAVRQKDTGRILGYKRIELKGPVRVSRTRRVRGRRVRVRRYG